MHKLFTLLIFLFLPLLTFAQSNLTIDSTSIPVRVKNDKISFKKRKKVSVKIPGKSILLDTVCSVNPETFELMCKLETAKAGYEAIKIKSRQLTLSRTDFLDNPLIYLHYKGLDYAAFKCNILYLHKGKIYGLGYDVDIKGLDFNNFSLHHLKNTTLHDFKIHLQMNLPTTVSEIYITGVKFVSRTDKKKFVLHDAFKVILKD